MNTLNQLAYSIIETVTPKAVITEPITLDIIKYHIKNLRAQFIKNELNKNRSIDNEIIQDLGCIPLVQADVSECCDTPIGCTFLRTAVPIPGFIELYHEPALTRVGPINKTSRPFQLIPYERIPFEFYNQFTRNEVKAYLMNSKGYLYLAIANDNILSKSLNKINIQGVLEDPSAAASFNQCDGTSCFNDDTTPYPIKNWMASAITSTVIKMFIDPEHKEPIDTSNDGRTDYHPTTTNK